MLRHNGMAEATRYLRSDGIQIVILATSRLGLRDFTQMRGSIMKTIVFLVLIGLIQRAAWARSGYQWKDEKGRIVEVGPAALPSVKSF